MADRKPRISVCVANYNGEEVLPDCLDSLYRQDLVDDFEIIVHDDASTDDSVKLIQSFYPDVQLLTSDRNVGFCISNNRMVSRASGEFILLLNNDAALFPDALMALLEEAEKHPDGAILTLPQFDWENGALVDRGSLLDPFYNPVPNKDPDRKEVAMAIGACLWIPRNEWERLGGFPDWFGSIAEDLWLCCKARLAGIPVYALQNSGFRHRQGHSFGGNRLNDGKVSSTLNRRQLSERNKTFVLFCMTPTPLLPFLLLIHSVMLIVEGVGLSVLKKDLAILTKIYVKALHETLAHRRTLARSRKHMQSDIKIGMFRYFALFTFLPRKLFLLFTYGVPNVSDRT